KYESIPKSLEEEYHTIKDDTLLVNVYTTGEGIVLVMQIPNELTPRATRTPNLDVVQKKKKGKQIDATQLSIALEKTTKVYEDQQNVAVVKKKILEEDVKKLVEGEDETDGDECDNIVLLSDEDS
nr:hypothetical protein [Tanacetum cinerariifolium]